MPAFDRWLNFVKSGGTNPGLLSQDAANPNDPAQQAQWQTGLSGASAQQASNINLLDPDTLAQLREMLAPYFQQTQQNFTGSFNQARQSQLGEAGRSAGALAAARGYNPASFVRSAQGRVNENLNPQYFSGMQNLLQGQEGSLLGQTGQYNQFRRQGLQGLSDAQFRNAQFFENRNQFNQQLNAQPGVLEDILGGLFGGGLNLLTGMAVGGTGLFGK